VQERVIGDRTPIVVRSNSSTLRRRLIRVAAVAFFGVLTAFYIIPRFFPWSEWNCEHQELDINTARLKFSSYLFFVKISERVEESDLSRVLPKEFLDRATPEWHRVNTFSPGVRVSPHYVFHSGMYQIRQLSNWWEGENVPDAMRQETARHMIALWKFDRSDSLAGDYLASLPYSQSAAQLETAPGRAASIEMPLVDTNGSNLTLTFFYPSGTRLVRCRGYFDSAGGFVRDGVLEQWDSDGKIHLYNHYKRGRIDGSRFSWGRDGKLSCIEGFRSGQLVEFESENLERHPDYPLAEKIRAVNGIESMNADTNGVSSTNR